MPKVACPHNEVRRAGDRGPSSRLVMEGFPIGFGLELRHKVATTCSASIMAFAAWPSPRISGERRSVPI